MRGEHARLPSGASPGLIGRLSSALGFRPPRKRRRTALDRRRYDGEVSLGKSPTLPDIERLARKAGFRALLNLNTEGEPGEILSPNVEASWANAFEIQHERVSIDLEALRPAGVDEFLDTLREIAKPVYVHSLLGRRAAALMTVHLALEREITGTAALAEARTQGFDCALERLQRFTTSEVDRRAPAPSTLDPTAGPGSPRAPGSDPG